MDCAPVAGTDSGGPDHTPGHLCTAGLSPLPGGHLLKARFQHLAAVHTSGPAQMAFWVDNMRSW